MGKGGFGSVYRGADDSVPNSTAATSIDPRILGLHTKVTDVVAINERKNVIRILTMGGDDASNKKMKILRIVGYGGLGKTTLATVVYEDLKAKITRDFDAKCQIGRGDFGVFYNKEIMSRNTNIIGSLGYFNNTSASIKRIGSPCDVEFSVTPSAKGGIDKKNGSPIVHVPKYLSVHDPTVQMVLALDKFDCVFSCLKSMLTKGIFDMAKRSHHSKKIGSPCVVEFSVTALAKGDIDIKIGSLIVHVPEYLSVHHPLVRMVLFAREKLVFAHGKFNCVFSCLKSMVPKIIFDMAKRSHHSKKIESPCAVEFSVMTSAKGGIDKKIGSPIVHVPKYLSVHHPLVQMVLFAHDKFDYAFSYLKSVVPKSIFDIAKRSHHSDPDSSRAEHGIKEGKAKISAPWVVSTAAPHHATGNRDLLSGFITEHDDQFVHALDGVPMPVRARGAVVTDAMVLPDVWFVPGLTVNLVSVCQLAELAYSVRFGDGECCIRSAAGGKTVGNAHLQESGGGLYVLDFLKIPLAI